MEFQPKVLVNLPEKEFRWLGHLWVKGLFDGEHFFQLEPVGEGHTHLVHGEKFTGLFSSLIVKMIGADTLKSFQAMNQALNDRVKSQVG